MGSFQGSDNRETEREREKIKKRSEREIMSLCDIVERNMK